MLKNITLSAEERFIQLAREKAAQENSTLNSQFRAWLERYVSSQRQRVDYDFFMDQIAYAEPGRKFSRDEMNER